MCFRKHGGQINRNIAHTGSNLQYLVITLKGKTAYDLPGYIFICQKMLAKAFPGFYIDHKLVLLM